MAIPAGFGKVRGAPEVPSKVLLDLVAAGALDPNLVHLPPPERCKCIHVPQAHPNGGPCSAKPCRKWGLCQRYERDERYTIPVGDASNVHRRKLKITEVDAAQHATIL